MLNVFQPSTGQAELSAIAETFESNWLGKGKRVAEFEAAWAKHIGTTPDHVVSTTSATEGLFQICELIGLHRGDKVIMPTVSFIGAANAVLATGATPVFCDVDRYTLNPRLSDIQAVYTKHTFALILLHYGGSTQELGEIRCWCNENDVVMIEDAACAQATTYRGKVAGTCGHYGVWSFDAMKVITTGDGGMIYCEDANDAKRLRQRMYMGLEESSGLSSTGDKWWQFSTNHPGRRAIMNDIAASMGLAQLPKLSEFVERRQKIVGIYFDQQLVDHVGMPNRIPTPYYFFWIQTSNRDELAKHLKANGIYTTFRYYPLHLALKTGDSLPNAEWAANNTLLLPLHQSLSDDDVMFVCDKVKEFFA